MKLSSITHYVDIHSIYIITAYLSSSWEPDTLTNTFNRLPLVCVQSRSTTIKWWDLLVIPRLQVLDNSPGLHTTPAMFCPESPRHLPCHKHMWTHHEVQTHLVTQHMQRPVVPKSTLMDNGLQKIMYTLWRDLLHFHSQCSHISSHGKEQNPFYVAKKSLNYFIVGYPVLISWRSANIYKMIRSTHQAMPFLPSHERCAYNDVIRKGYSKLP